MNESILHIVYSSDDNYAQHTGVSIVSLLENNKHFKNIFIYIIDNKISDKNRNKLLEIIDKYNRNIEFIEFEKYKTKLNLDMEWDISISSYARLFLSSMLPNNVDKVLYYDCDTVIEGKLDDIWNIDLDKFYVAGVQDTISNKTKESVGIPSKYKYINAGMLLVNLKMWRESRVEDKFIDFINNYNGRVNHHDQGVINGVLYKNIKILPPKFNLMTVFYTMKREDIIKYYKIETEFYSQEEINESLNDEIYIHYTPGFTSRPWIKGCRHPRKHLYWKYLEISPWKDYKYIKDNSRLQIKIINFIYRNIPFNIADKFITFAKNVFLEG
ncbi:MAG: glycosyltransferase family 8 protein [Romboutsia timonensis]|uniref:glycosyltransferase family 8 protein n=1 Tax=Romboutsia timonensis TaxID=1776391 RepID=UPI002A748529|nr:glycosyltransferase family 8 protein [Romboutsia timonensis]MDY3002436.1 glycosyltransferase family 8 protein [Romboutsia timonensis]